MRTKIMAFGFGLAMLLAAAVPAFGGVGTALAHTNADVDSSSPACLGRLVVAAIETHGNVPASVGGVDHPEVESIREGFALGRVACGTGGGGA